MNIAARMALASAQISRGQEFEAIEMLKEVLGQYPDFADAHALLAYALVRKVRVVAAEHEARLALSLDASCVLAHSVLAQVAFLLGRFDDALQHCDEALSIEPENCENLLQKAQLLEAFSRDEEAMLHIQEALKVDPESVDAWCTLASFCLDKGQLSECRDAIEHAMKMDPEDAQCHVVLGRLELKRGHLELAREHAHFAIMQSPEDQQALQLLSDIKASENWFVGLWWRFNSAMTEFSQQKQIAVLIGGYLFFNLLALILGDFGYTGLATIVSSLWIGLVVYSWIGIPIYRKMLKKELGRVELKGEY